MARDNQVKHEKLDATQQGPAGAEQISAERKDIAELGKNPEPPKGPESSPVRELTRDFDIS